MLKLFYIFTLLVNSFVFLSNNIIITPESCGTSLNGTVHKHITVGGFFNKMNIAGIYKITNIINDKSYIGQSLNIRFRITRHRYLLNKCKHFNKYLQSSYNKYGSENFKFEIIYSLDANSIFSKQEIQDILNNKESELIIKFNSFNDGYNLTTGGDGCVVSDATRIKLSESHKGIKPSELCRKKTSERCKNVPKSEETKKRMSVAQSKVIRKYPVWNKGKSGYKIKPASESRKRKIGEAQIGIKNHNYGKTTPESVKQKCRDSYHGEMCHLAKLNEDMVKQIKSELNRGIKGPELSKRYNVTVSTISRIKLNQTWKHIK